MNICQTRLDVRITTVRVKKSLQQQQQMKFGRLLSIESRSQWRECYINYENLKIFIILIQRIVQIIDLLSARELIEHPLTQQSPQKPTENAPNLEGFLTQSREIIVRPSSSEQNHHDSHEPPLVAEVADDMASIENLLTSFNEANHKKRLSTHLKIRLDNANQKFAEAYQMYVTLTEKFASMKLCQLEGKTSGLKNEVILSSQQLTTQNDENIPIQFLIKPINYQNAAKIDSLAAVSKKSIQSGSYGTTTRLALPNMLFSKEKRSAFITMVELIYIEAQYLIAMIESNTNASRKILKKHKKYADTLVETPKAIKQTFEKQKKSIHSLKNDLQDIYIVLHPLLQSKKARQQLRTKASTPQTEQQSLFMSGLWMGVSLSVIVLLVILLKHNNISIDNDARFSRDFPTWRGSAIFIAYIWVLGLNTYVFQHYQINHSIIMNFNDHHASTAIDIFKIAGAFTSIFLVLFMLYCLVLTGFFSLGSLASHYMPAIMWCCLIFYLIFPLPYFQHRSRLYAIRLLWESLAAPVIGVKFPVIWMTDQLISLLTPLKDLAYTVCYYTELDHTDLSKNPCNSNSNASVIILFGICIYIYRILQCSRQAYDKKKYWGTHEMYNSGKYTFSLITLIVSYVYRAGTSTIFLLWVIAAIVSTIYSFTWDLVIDWSLCQKNDRHYGLRKHITFAKWSYYCIMVCNFLLRLAWTLTLSPNIVLLFGNSNMLTLTTGFLEIARRGVWNLLRVQREHLDNCGRFQAIPNCETMSEELKALSDKILSSQIAQGIHLSISEIKEQITVREKFESIYDQAYLEKEIKLLDSYAATITPNKNQKITMQRISKKIQKLFPGT